MRRFGHRSRQPSRRLGLGRPRIPRRARVPANSARVCPGKASSSRRMCARSSENPSRLDRHPAAARQGERARCLVRPASGIRSDRERSTAAPDLRMGGRPRTPPVPRARACRQEATPSSPHRSPRQCCAALQQTAEPGQGRAGGTTWQLRHRKSSWRDDMATPSQEIEKTLSGQPIVDFNLQPRGFMISKTAKWGFSSATSTVAPRLVGGGTGSPASRRPSM
jgi:hypothetical protein